MITWFAVTFERKLQHSKKRQLTLRLSFSLKIGLNNAYTMLNTYGWLTMWTFLTLIGTESCSQSIILFAIAGVNCQACWRVSPSISKITTTPAICVIGSNMAASIKKTQPLNISSKLHLLCFHLFPISITIILRPYWSRIGNTTRMFCSNIFLSRLGLRSLYISECFTLKL